MVAYTPDFCLPYFECSDNPCVNTGTDCDPSTVWADMVRIVDAQLSAVDGVIGRTADAIPIGSVSYIPDTPVALSGQIPFDIINADTDSMVDLTLFQGITPQRNGVYRVDARVLYQLIGTNEIAEALIVIGNETTPDVGGPIRAVASGTSRGFNASMWVYASTLWPFGDTSPLPRGIWVSEQYVVQPVVEAHLDVVWHSELDS